jgi:prophage antirepressor-like protein
MSNLKTLANPFQFDNLDVRTAIDEDNVVWFCRKDVRNALDIAWKDAEIALDNMLKNWFMIINLGEIEEYFINEAGLYLMVFNSNKPKSKEFANWVCTEVLPQIRKYDFLSTLPAKY